MHWINYSPELTHVESFSPGLGKLLFESIKNGDLKGFEDVAHTTEWEIMLQHRFSFVESSRYKMAIESNAVYLRNNSKRNLHFCFHIEVLIYSLFRQ